MNKIPEKFNLLEKRFSRLIVKKYIGTRHRSRLWLCLCDCGQTKEITTQCLIQNGTRSCGCLQREVRKNKPNQRKLPPGIGTRNKLLCDYKNSARVRNLTWEISNDKAFELFKSNCKLCCIEPSSLLNYRQHNGTYLYNGIDRIDNKIGYVENNVQTLCKRCNIAKNNMTNDEFISWVKRIVYNYDKTRS